MMSTSHTRGSAAAGPGVLPPHPDDLDWIEPERPRRDWKKIFLILGLGALSWVATYVGMLELIQANMGELSLVHKVVIGFSVAMLMTMIVWLLDQLFSPLPLATKAAYVLGYLFLTLISVGFGFGFYWKVLESRQEASRSAESAVSQVQAALYGASSRLDQLQTTLDQLHTISLEKSVLERDRGASCPNSRPGDGPRRKLRDADAAQFSFAASFVKGRSGKVKADMRTLDADLKKITSGDSSIVDPATGTRNKFLQALTRKLELTATGFNAFRTDPQLRQIRTELAERSTQTVFPTGRENATFSCPDPQLQSALRGVVRAIDQLPELGKPQIATVEGAQAVVEAFRRLTTTLYGVLSFKLPPSADELRALQQKAVQSVESNAAAQQAQIGAQQGGLSKRDYIPLAIAMFVDLCLLLVSIGRPMNRLHNLVPKMREAERGPVYQILSRFDDIHRDEEVREKFEIFRHVVFDFNGDYYVAVPLDAPRRRNPEEIEKLQLEAHLLGNLFASFEKEKIFTRVYNPLLSRKTIERKLERQGSKFATSSAFRIYRFKDGAWSDIILGAVMGAARRASAERRREAFLRGPTLDSGAATTVRADDKDEGQSSRRPTTESQPEPETILDNGRRKYTDRDYGRPAHEADAAWPPSQGAERLKPGATAASYHPFDDAGEDYDALDEAALQAKYGPYAKRMMRQDSRDRRPRPDPRRWPYRKPPAPIGEAEVELTLPDPDGLHGDDAARDRDERPAANNNTSPSGRHPDGAHDAFDSARGDWHDREPLDDGVFQMPQPSTERGETDNVIPLPGPRQSSLDAPISTGATSFAEPWPSLGGVAETPAAQGAQHLARSAEAPAYATARQDWEISEWADRQEPRINVRLTERTAEVSLPASEAALPDDLFGLTRQQPHSVTPVAADQSSGVRVTEARLPLLSASALEAEAEGHSNAIAAANVEATPKHRPQPPELPTNVAHIEHAAEAETVAPAMATSGEDSFDPSVAESAVAYSADPGDGERSGGLDDDLDPMVRVARRFAARRSPES